MLIGELIDTLLNLVTFAFIGAMAWLLIRRLPNESKKNGGRPRFPK